MEPNVNNWHEPQVMCVSGWCTGEYWVTYFAKWTTTTNIQCKIDNIWIGNTFSSHSYSIANHDGQLYTDELHRHLFNTHPSPYLASDNLHSLHIYQWYLLDHLLTTSVGRLIRIYYRSPPVNMFTYPAGVKISKSRFWCISIIFQNNCWLFSSFFTKSTSPLSFLE
jgi:hypothetical protein